ncbi:MAG: ABC-F family ATP-binding cassette domain-containing protein [Anaerocolumna sp.]
MNWKRKKITEGLKITETLKNMLFQQLSGGEKTRVILAKILLEEPDILLLDEPTNHLDLETIEWLEGFLKTYKGSVLIISHDRYFLDSVVGKIVELSFDRANIYMGNYSYYVLEKERRFLIDYKNYLNQQKKIDQMERQIERYRIWGEMRDSDKMFKRAKELEKRLAKIEVLDKPVLSDRKVRFNQEGAGRTGKIVLETVKISKSFGVNPLLKDINLNLFYQDSACIIGRNGCGKSTLLKMILGEIEPDSGTIKIGAQVKIGYLPQQVIFKDEDQTILEFFAHLHNITYEIARNQLAKVLFFKDDVYKKIRFLSGGEKSRLRLCSLTFEKVNFMILDEPTNHLDIESREVLEETFSEFEGTLLFVSHDRYFINKVADKIITIENNSLIIYQGDYNYYLEEYQKVQQRGVNHLS